MPSPRRNFSCCAAALLVTSVTFVAAQPVSGDPRTQVGSELSVAASQPAPQVTSEVPVTRMIDAETARKLWADPQIRGFKGLAENAHDFTDPNGVPGFGPLGAANQ